jgi:carbon starvation protein
LLSLIFLLSISIILLGYYYYGTFLERVFKINPSSKTPAHKKKDNIDYIPTPMPVLIGHHFSSIAGAGPVVGPIIAALAFGWLPALVWILIGSIFIGGVHDFSALIASVRHQGKSIAEIAHEYITIRMYKIFMIFIWLSLVYVLIVFLDLTATTFNTNGAVATSSLLFIFLAVIFGWLLYKYKLNLLKLSLIFVPLIFLGIYLGQVFPFHALLNSGKTWHMLLLIYAAAASILPVWILLQPRDYLSSYLLYASILAGFTGLLIGGNNFAIQYPAFITGKSFFPFMFVIIACGAVSGFHSLVASGTTSKQLNKETDAKPVAYGSMLIEAIIAIIALATVMIISKSGSVEYVSPLQIYANGIAKFITVFGIPYKVGTTFGLLTLSTFLLTTLDTATRLARYIIEEFFELKTKYSRYYATLATILLPGVFSFISIKDLHGKVIPAWEAIWPIFGVSNQLLAALGLLIIAIWLSKKKIKITFIVLPMLFMLTTTFWALKELIFTHGLTLVGIIAGSLTIFALLMIIESIKVFNK